MNKNKLAIIVLAVLLIFGFVACGDKKADTKPADIDKSDNEDGWADDSEYYFKDNVLKTKRAKMVITDVKVFTPEHEVSSDDWDGTGKNLNRKLIAFYYDFTNISNKEMSGYHTFKDCVDASQNIEGEGMVPLYSSYWSGDETTVDESYYIQPGETVKCATAYILESETAPVRLVFRKELSLAKDDVYTKDIMFGEKTYPL
jgi:hypothetical protein